MRRVFSRQETPLKALPNAAGILAAYHRLTSGAAEGPPELRHVRNSAVDAPLTGRVRVGLSVHTADLVALIGTPHLAPAEEESLLRSEPVDLVLLLASQHVEQCHIGDPQTAVIRNVLTERQFAVQLQVADRGV